MPISEPGGIYLNRNFSELTEKELARLPRLSFDHSCIAGEWIGMHLYNQKGMHWYIAEYGPIGKRFFGFYVNKTDGIASGFCEIDEILKFERKGGPWTPLVDDNWRQQLAIDVPILTEYIKLVVYQPDIT